MKLNLAGVLLIFIGVLLMYSAHVHRDARNVVFEALGSKRRVGREAGIDGVGKGVGDAVGGIGGKVPNPGTKPIGATPKPGVPVVTV